MKRLAWICTLLLAALPLTTWAGTKATRHTATIDLTEPAMVAGVELQPGQYTLRWNDTGSKVPIEFMKNGKTVTTVDANVQEGHHAQKDVKMNKDSKGREVISEIDRSKWTLQFPTS